MAGHGGRRPGSGRKRKETVNEQQTRRDVLLKVFSPERWRRIAERLATKAEAGDLLVLLPYLPYLLGSPKQEIEINVHQVAEELSEKYGVEPERVTNLVERLKAKRAG
jgi:hypothetical protein